MNVRECDETKTKRHKNYKLLEAAIAFVVYIFVAFVVLLSVE